MNAFLLAAGLGTRLRPFTETMAKPSISFLGLPQILYPYYFCKELGIETISYNTHHNPESVNKVLSDFKIQATNYFESTILNSGGGVSHARESLINSDPFLVINADSLFIYDEISQFKQILKNHINEGRLATLLTIKKSGCGHSFPGLESNSEGKLISAGLAQDVYKDMDHDQRSDKRFTHFIGVYIFSNDIFKYLKNQPDNLIYDVLLKLKDQNTIKVEVLNGVSWYELGTIKDYKTNYLILENQIASNADATHEDSFCRTHKYFKTIAPEHYPYDTSLEQQILRSL